MTCKPRPVSHIGRFMVVTLELEPENDLEKEQFQLAADQKIENANPMFAEEMTKILSYYYPGFESAAVVDSEKFPYRVEVELVFP